MSRPLNIVQVTDLYEPFAGGLEHHVGTLSRELARRGHEVTVVTSRLPGTLAEETADGVRIRRIESWSGRVLAGWYERPEVPFHPPVPDPGSVRSLNMILDELRPDIVHAHGWIGYSCLATARRRRPPLIVTLHDYGAMCARKTLLRDGREMCAGPRLDRCLRCAPGQYGAVKGIALAAALRAARMLHGRVDSWIAVSRFVAASSRGWLPREAVISVIPPAVEQPLPAAPRPSWLPASGYLLFVGALGRYKGLHWLLDAYAAAELSPLVVIGTPCDEAPQTWPRNVIVRTAVPHQQVMAAWQHARLAIVPSLWPEPSALAAVEAMSSAIPVVASRIGGMPEIVADGVTGILVTPGSTAELRAALLRLDNSAELRRAMGIAGLSRAERFSAAAVAGMHEQHYRHVLDQRPGPARTPPRTPEGSSR